MLIKQEKAALLGRGRRGSELYAPDSVRSDGFGRFLAQPAVQYRFLFLQITKNRNNIYRCLRVSEITLVGIKYAKAGAAVISSGRKINRERVK